MKKRISSLMAMLLLIILGSQALYLDNSKELLKFRSIIQEARSMEGLSSEPANSYKPYVVYKDFTLTFYCDDLRNSREGTIYNLNEGANEPEWLKDEKNRNVEKVVFDASFANARPTTTYSWFQNCDIMKEVKGLNYLNTSKVKNMHTMFAFCRKLKSVDVSHFNTKEVQDMGAMFSLCTSLETINLGSFDTSNLWMMMSMFNQCQSLTEINLSSFNTSKVEYFSYLFNGCNSLKKIYLGSGFASTNNASCDETFGECQNLTNIIFTGDIPASINSKFFESVGTTASPATLVVPKQYKANYQAKFDGDSFYGGHFSLQETNAIVGDVNGDGEVNEVDVAEVEKVILDPSIQRLPAMDVNQDGEVNAADIVVIVNIIKIGSNPNTGSGYFWLGTYLPKSSTFPTLGGKEVAGIVTTYTSLDDAMAKASRAYSAGEYAVVMYPSSWGTKDDLVLMDSANKTYYAIKKKVLSDFPDYNYYESTEKIGFNATITLSTETAAKAAGASIYKTPVAPTPSTGNDNTDTELEDEELYEEVANDLHNFLTKNSGATIESIQAEIKKYPSVTYEVKNDILYLRINNKYDIICDPYCKTRVKKTEDDLGKLNIEGLLEEINNALYPKTSNTRVGYSQNLYNTNSLTRGWLNRKILNKAKILIWDPWELTKKGREEEPEKELTQLLNRINGLEVTSHTGRAATLSDIKSFKDYDVVYMCCHGLQEGGIYVRIFDNKCPPNIISGTGKNTCEGMTIKKEDLEEYLPKNMSKTILWTAICWGYLHLKEMAKNRKVVAFAGCDNECVTSVPEFIFSNFITELYSGATVLNAAMSSFPIEMNRGFEINSLNYYSSTNDNTVKTDYNNYYNPNTNTRISGSFIIDCNNPDITGKVLIEPMSPIDNRPRVSLTGPYEWYNSSTATRGTTRANNEGGVKYGFWIKNINTGKVTETEIDHSVLLVYSRQDYKKMISRLELLCNTEELEPGTYEYSTYLVVDGEKEYSKEKYEFKKEETSDQGTSGENKDPIHIIPIYR